MSISSLPHPAPATVLAATRGDVDGLSDRHCTFPGCTRPPVMGHAHHIRHWAHGGATALSNLVLLCGAHHRVLHHTPWQVRLSTDGHPEFLPPPRMRSSDPPAWTRHRPRRE